MRDSQCASLLPAPMRGGVRGGVSNTQLIKSLSLFYLLSFLSILVPVPRYAAHVVVARGVHFVGGGVTAHHQVLPLVQGDYSQCRLFVSFLSHSCKIYKVDKKVCLVLSFSIDTKKKTWTNLRLRSRRCWGLPKCTLTSKSPRLRRERLTFTLVHFLSIPQLSEKQEQKANASSYMSFILS